MTNDFCAPATKFAGMVGLPYATIKKYIEQGRIPFIREGKCHTKIPIEKGREAIERIAEENAAMCAQSIPTNIQLPEPDTIPLKKRNGRIPDKVKKLKLI